MINFSCKTKNVRINKLTQTHTKERKLEMFLFSHKKNAPERRLRIYASEHTHTQIFVLYIKIFFINNFKYIYI